LAGRRGSDGPVARRRYWEAHSIPISSGVQLATGAKAAWPAANAAASSTGLTEQIESAPA
jgi:hypothetical protein